MAYSQDIQHALLAFASTFAPYDAHPLSRIGQFATGMVWAHMLATVDGFEISMSELQGESSKWIERLTNLKKLVAKMQGYVGEGGRSLRTGDIDLIEIAKHESADQILRFFELVIAVFMHSPHKEEYIQTIMRLDERSQQALVVIVQNAIDERLTEHPSSNGNQQLMAHCHDLTTENQQLREEVQELTAAAEKYRREASELRDRLEEAEEAEEKSRSHSLEAGSEQLRGEVEQLRAMNDNLKQRLLQTVREHQEELSRLREENIFLQNRVVRYKEYEEAVEQLKEQLADAQAERERNSEQEREKRRLQRLVEEKEAMINKMKEKMEEVSEKNYSMQEHELYMKMELEKKEVRFKQLEKEVKSRLRADPFPNNAPLLPSPTATPDNEEIDYLQEELDKMRNSYRELQRDNLKLKKKLQKSQSMQGQKKKLQKIILDVSKTKDTEIEMLLVSLYDLRSENIRIHQLLSKQT